MRGRTGARSRHRDVRDLAAACHARLSSSGNSPQSRGRGRRAARGSRPQSSRSPSSAVASRGGRSATRRFAGRGRRRCPRSSGSPSADKFDDAYRLAQQAQPYIPDDPLLAEQIRAISRARDHRLRSGRRVTSSTARTAAAASRGGRWARRPSRCQRATRPAALEDRDGGPRDGGRRWSWPFARSRGSISHSSPANQVAARHGTDRIVRCSRFNMLMPGLEHLPEVTPAGLLD